MVNFFSLHTEHPFVLFSLSHRVTLAVTLLLLLVLYFGRRRFRQPLPNLLARIVLVVILLISEAAGFIWLYEEHVFTVTDSLPLQLCDISLMLCVVMLLFPKRSYRLFEIVYFIGVGGAGQAILTPDLAYDFPHFAFFDFFLTHIGIVLSCLFVAWTEGYRPRYVSIWKTMLFLNWYMFFILWLNHVTHGNYLYLAYKPEHGSLMDYLGPYPWYIASLEGVALVLFHLLYLPFAKSNRKEKRGG